MMKKTALVALSVTMALAASLWLRESVQQYTDGSGRDLSASQQAAPGKVVMPEGMEHLAVATVAGGCFWCVEDQYERVPGVKDVVSGYTGGHKPMPTYLEVARGKTRHTEGVQIYYDPKVITYEGLLQALWRTADPTDATGQYHDRGHQYRPGIYYHNDEQKRIALAAREALDKSGRYKKPVVIEIAPFTSFYKAEKYHQDYAQKNPIHYLFYTYGSGRAGYQERIWGDELEIDYSKYRPQPKPKAAPDASGMISDMPNKHMSDGDMPDADDMIVPISNETTDSGKATKGKKMSYTKPPLAELKKRLTPLQFEVTQEEGTERPFSNEYWDNKRDGIYVDVVSGEPLFSSTDKYKSGTGWPSFTRPLEADHIVEKTDRKLFMTRTEVRSKHGGSHLGHVFNDGPAPTGLRYCMNSASMRFIPKEELEKEGYGQYLKLFEGK